MKPTFWYTQAKEIAEEFLRERQDRDGLSRHHPAAIERVRSDDRTMSMLVLDGIERECRPSWGMATRFSASAMSRTYARPAFLPAR